MQNRGNGKSEINPQPAYLNAPASTANESNEDHDIENPEEPSRDIIRIATAYSYCGFFTSWSPRTEHVRNNMHIEKFYKELDEADTYQDRRIKLAQDVAFAGHLFNSLFLGILGGVVLTKNRADGEDEGVVNQNNLFNLVAFGLTFTVPHLITAISAGFQQIKSNAEEIKKINKESRRTLKKLQEKKTSPALTYQR